MTRLPTSLTALAAAGALLAGCGGSDSSSAQTTSTAAAAAPAPASAASGGLTLKAVESGGLSFDHKTLKAKAGTVSITMDHPSGDSQPHAIAVTGPGGVQSAGQVAQPGGTSKVSLKLKAGTYTFYCPVGSHRQAGMEGTLTVQ